jgi:hypothetical protein
MRRITCIFESIYYIHIGGKMFITEVADKTETRFTRKKLFPKHLFFKLIKHHCCDAVLSHD